MFIALYRQEPVGQVPTPKELTEGTSKGGGEGGKEAGGKLGKSQGKPRQAKQAGASMGLWGGSCRR